MAGWLDRLLYSCLWAESAWLGRGLNLPGGPVSHFGWGEGRMMPTREVSLAERLLPGLQRCARPPLAHRRDIRRAGATGGGLRGHRGERRQPGRYRLRAGASPAAARRASACRHSRAKPRLRRGSAQRFRRGPQGAGLLHRWGRAVRRRGTPGPSGSARAVHRIRERLQARTPRSLRTGCGSERSTTRLPVSCSASRSGTSTATTA